MEAIENKHFEFKKAALLLTYTFLICFLTVFIICVDNFEILGGYINNSISWVAQRIGTQTSQIDFGSLALQKRILANLILFSFSAWLATLWKKTFWRVSADSCGFFTLFLAFQIAAYTCNFWFSLIAVAIITLLMATDIVDYTNLKRKKSDESISPIVLWSSSLFVASGLATVAGYFPPFDFAQPLKQSVVIHRFLDFRIIFSVVFFSVFLGSILVSAFISVWKNNEARRMIKQPVFAVSSKKTLQGRLINIIISLILIIIQPLVEFGRWIIRIIFEIGKTVWAFIADKIVRQAFIRAAFFLASFFLIGHASFRIAANLISLLRFESPLDSLGVSQELTLLGWCLCFTLVAILGVVFFTLISLEKAEEGFHIWYAGRLVTCLASTWVCGLIFFLVRKSGWFPQMRGFDHLGIFFIVVPTAAFILLFVLWLFGKWQNR